MASDVRRKHIVAMEVMDEGTGDGRMLQPMVEHSEENIRVLNAIGDGAYELRFNFTFLAARDIEPIIKVSKISSGRVRECPARKEIVLEYLRDVKA